MINISELWDAMEYAYIEEKLGKWLRRDIEILGEFLTNYIESGNPQYIEEFRKGVAYLADPQSNLNRELAYIESKRKIELPTDTNAALVDDIWEAIFGCWGADYWASAIRKPDGSDIDLWNYTGKYEPAPQDFKVLDGEEGKWYQVKVSDLVEAYNRVSQAKTTHCMGHRVDDLEDPDACVSDILLQTAVFGDTIYG